MSPIVSNLIIILILGFLLFFSVKSTISHFRGEGSCCGGGSRDVKVKTKKLGTVVSTKVIKIDGMHCEHCYARVHNTLNSMDGVSARICGKKGEAVIRLEKEIDDSVLMKVIDDLGYTAVSIKNV